MQTAEAPTAVARDMGLYANRIFVWLAAYRNGGWDALRARKAMGRPKRLQAKQNRWIYDTVATKNPLQFKLPFALWTRAQIWTLIAQRFVGFRNVRVHDLKHYLPSLTMSGRALRA